MEYLRITYAVEPTRGQELVARLAGGRFVLLNQYGKPQYADIHVSQLLSSVWDITDKSLKALSIKPTDDLFRKLVAQSQVPKWDSHRVFLNKP